jgi:hypothetical protein
VRSSGPVARHPRVEAEEHLGGDYGVRVLEPSPPAIEDEPWFADDPVNEPALSPVVSPVPNGDLLWAELAATNFHLARWATDRSLVPAPLPSLPDGLAAARDSLHQVAFHVIAPVRQAANSKIGLRFTRGGFGTPFFGADRQLRVEGPYLVDQRGMDEIVEPLTTIGAARSLVGTKGELSLDGPPRWDDSRELRVEPEHVAFFASWFGTVTRVLEMLRLETPDLEPSRVQIWPEHFDGAVEIGPEERWRASFGGSPGDGAHPEPYVYVSPWTPPAPDAFWNDQAFGGASLGYADLGGQPNPDGALLDFFHRGVSLLGAGMA